MSGILTADQVREYLQDYPEANLLLDKEEFKDTYIELCMDLAVSEYNSLSPSTGFNIGNFPSKSILMLGTCWQMFLGRAALAARNHLTYTDGGLSIPVEEKYEIYKNLADTYKTMFTESASKLKISQNIESGWGQIRSDESNFPYW